MAAPMMVPGGGYPPLATLAEKPLHNDGKPLWPEHFWACMATDDEGDADNYESFVHYDWRCGACLHVAKADLWADGDRLVEWRWTNDTPIQFVSFSWLVERATYLEVLGQ